MENLAKALVRFHARVRVSESGCWEWTGGKARHGYGSFYFQGELRVAHRWSYQYIGGNAIEPGLVIHHVCENPPCVNPAHLQQVTQQENVLASSWRRRKTHCKRGHALTPENVYTVSSNGGRGCLTCRKEYDRARYLRLKAEASA